MFFFSYYLIENWNCEYSLLTALFPNILIKSIFEPNRSTDIIKIERHYHFQMLYIVQVIIAMRGTSTYMNKS